MPKWLRFYKHVPDNTHYAPDTVEKQLVFKAMPESVKKNIEILDEMQVVDGAVYGDAQGDEFRILMHAFPQGSFTSQSTVETLPMQNPRLKPEEMVRMYHTPYASSTTGDCFINCLRGDEHFQLTVPGLVELTGWKGGVLPMIRHEDTTPGLTPTDKRKLKDHYEQKKAENTMVEEEPESRLAEKPEKPASKPKKRGRSRR